MFFKYLLLLLFVSSLFSCKEKQKSDSANVEKQQEIKQHEETETYFSISDYFADQWEYRRGDPYTLLKLIYSNGKPDSSYVVLDSALWFRLCAPFNAADISAPHFLGKYNFDMFDDQAMEMTYLHYEAKSPDLLMQKMHIGADMYNNKIKTVYMETKLSRPGYIIMQKLQYIPDRSFQIQEYEKPAGYPEKETRTEYLFTY